MGNLYTPGARQSIARFLLLLTVGQLATPLAGWALTSGPTQPEFAGFTPVTATDMVNKFTGDFNYNLPLLEVPGPGGSSYPINLAYHGGESAEDEASWVGYGWNLGPGTITRNARGLPDDFYDEEIEYVNRTPRNFTLTTGLSAGLEMFSIDNLVGLNANVALRYNNYAGFGYNRGVGISLGKGLVSLGVNDTDGQTSYSARVNPGAFLLAALEPSQQPNKGPATRGHLFVGFKENLKLSLQKAAKDALRAGTALDVAGGNHGMLDFNEGSRSTQVGQYSGNSYNVTFGASINPAPVPIGITGNVSGSYTYQDALPSDRLRAYGYMYSAEATARKKSDKAGGTLTNVQTDYYTEKDSPYSKRDVFLGVPFGNADLYSVSGDGIGGSFQLHHDQVGEFGPNAKKSETTIYNLGADVSVGWTFGVGVKGSIGKHTLSESSWTGAVGGSGDLLPFSSVQSGSSYFRFANDLGNTVGQHYPANDPRASDAPLTAGFTATSGGFLTKGYNPATGDLLAAMGQAAPAADAPRRPAQASHVGQHTVAEAERPYMFRYCKRADIDALRERPASGNAGGGQQSQAVAEFRLTNDGGRQFTYGLPVYARNELSMQYGVQGVSASSVINNFLVYKGQTDKEIMMGQRRNGAYATSYLLTEITTPDYIDRQLDGPDESDFGGYTAFSYVKKHGGRGAGNGSWYRWRLPYTGHVYEANSLSDSGDDLGTVAEGDKEICYLQAIRTKTHTAIFYTSPRADGYGASTLPAVRTDSTLVGDGRLCRLDSVVLYANQDVQKEFAAGSTTQFTWKAIARRLPLKSIYLDYTYDLCPGTPNTAVTGGRHGGKLTLTKVTTAYQRVVLARPYEFKYSYPDYSTYPDIYVPQRTGLPVPATVVDFSRNYTFAAPAPASGSTPAVPDAQNPEYQRYCLNAWGNYQGNDEGRRRFANLQTWPDQRTTTYDPAAWQLKRIVLPTGGEIHVQYEQDDYAYVQDQTAHALASLTTAVPSSNNEFVIDPASVGLQPTDVAACVSLIKQLYVSTGQKMYFKLLYKLVDRGVPQGVRDCNTDYITGYVSVRDAQVYTTGGRTYIKLVLVGNNNSSAYTLPREVCLNFVKTQRLGKLQQGSNCSPSVVGINPLEPSATQLVRQFTAWATRVAPSLKSLTSNDANLCAALKPELSYFKLPLPTSKKGGGLRVKRLLTYSYDPALDARPKLYGTEYEYRAYDNLTRTWRSSGVATTEPTPMREENALVSFIPRLQQGNLQKIIAGPDRKQSEGPIGESILPGAAVGYSRVTVKNIHAGLSNPGYTISEYYTCKDAPMQWRMTNLDSRNEYRSIFTGLFNTLDNNIWATQGFSFVLNSMHGQPRREATYAGAYSDSETQTKATLVAEQLYQYQGFTKGRFEPGDIDEERPRVQDEPEALATQLPARIMPGKDVELAMAQRSVRDRTLEAGLEGDVQFTPLIFIMLVYVTGSGSLSKFTSDISTHTTSKVVRYPAIVRQVISAHDGVRDTLENRVFDSYTGSAVTVRSSDAGRGAFQKQTVMGSWVYPQMQGKSFNEGLTLTAANGTASWAAVSQENGRYYLKATNASDCTLLATVRKGDVLALNKVTGALYFADAPDLVTKRVRLYPYATPGGTPPTVSSVAKVSIVFSGNTNELRTEVGSTTYHGSARRTLDFVSKPEFTKDGSGNSTDALALALQAAIRALPSPPPGSAGTAITTDFTLGSGSEFTNINAAGFVDHFTDPACASDAARARVRNLKFTAYRDPSGQVVRIQLLSFEMYCTSTGGFVPVK
jgi:hypothetical protein